MRLWRNTGVLTKEITSVSANSASGMFSFVDGREKSLARILFAKKEIMMITEVISTIDLPNGRQNRYTYAEISTSCERYFVSAGTLTSIFFIFRISLITVRSGPRSSVAPPGIQKIYTNAR